MVTVWRVVADVLFAFLGLMLVRLVFDYVQIFARQWRPKGVVLVLLELCYSVTDPPLRALRRVLPALRIGRAPVDIAWMTLFFAVLLLRSVVRSL